ncbi:MAG: hypothetical protein GEU96_17985 [Propionibacteriales bacterium]|nr:hypothetical protein [Propionibacteriales bacterium]
MSRPADWAPLAGSDPVSGDPAAVKKLADRYRDTATAIDNAVKRLRAIHDDSSGAWVSPAGTAFRERTGEMADSIARAFGRYDRAATALASYSGKLDSVQERADDLLAKAKVAQEAADDAERDACPSTRRRCC